MFKKAIIYEISHLLKSKKALLSPAPFVCQTIVLYVSYYTFFTGRFGSKEPVNFSHSA